jgi:DNA polymerase III sliding clamp (beta) subunit (PCNA family)
MKTETLNAALKLCRGAIDNVALFPIFNHFCFNGDGQIVYAYNDVAAIITTLDSNINVGLRADVLLGVLPTLAQDLELKTAGDTVKLTSGRVKLEMASMPQEAFQFDPPEPEWDISIPINAAFMAGLTRCAHTVDDKSMIHREFTGISFEAAQGTLTIYSSDNIRLSRFIVGACSPKLEATWIVPARSCALFLDAWQATEESTLHLGKEWALLNTPNLLVYSKTIPEKPPKFRAAIERIMPAAPSWYKVPDELRAAVARAEVLVAKDPTAGVAFALSKGQLDVTLPEDSGIRFGTFEERIPIKGAKEIVEITVGIVKINQSLAEADEMLFHSRCIGMRTGEYTCWMAPFSV